MRLLKKTQNSTQAYDIIVEEAAQLFIDKPFEEITMQEIADNAKVGIGHLYTYFSTKRDLLFTVALTFWHKKYLVNEDIMTDELNGIQSIDKLIDEEVRIFMEYPERYVFLEKFDNYVKNYLRTSQIKDVKQLEFLERYEIACKHDENIWKMSLLSGIADHSIREDLDMSLTVYSLSIMEMSVFQKFANRRIVIEQDLEYNTEEILRVLKDMILTYLSAK